MQKLTVDRLDEQEENKKLKAVHRITSEFFTILNEIGGNSNASRLAASDLRLDFIVDAQGTPWLFKIASTGFYNHARKYLYESK